MGRYMSLVVVAAATLAVAVVVSGCGDSRSILYAGVTPRVPPVSSHPSPHPQVVTDAEAVRAGLSAHAYWLSHLASARGRPDRPLSPRQFRRRVASAAGRYGFTVKRVRFVRRTRRKVAPLVIVETSSYLAYAHALSAIVGSLAPHPALYLEAIDERGVPFLIVTYPPGGWSIWARSDPLLQPLGA
jgi:hypothetical protein